LKADFAHRQATNNRSGIASGKVVEETVIYDALGMLRQVGVVPAAIAKAA
jgi:hypothetical protein